MLAATTTSTARAIRSMAGPSVSVLGKRPLGRSQSMNGQENANNAARAGSSQKLKRRKTETIFGDKDGNKENIPPLRAVNANLVTATRRLARNGSMPSVSRPRTVPISRRASQVESGPRQSPAIQFEFSLLSTPATDLSSTTEAQAQVPVTVDSTPVTPPTVESPQA